MLSYDLRHTIYNVYCNPEEIILREPIDFLFNPKLNTGLHYIDEPVKHKITRLYRKGRSWKMCDEFDNEWTLSTLSWGWQNCLYNNLMSMRDKRYKSIQNLLFL